MTLAPVFSREATHLLCPSATGAKFNKAREWGVPVVHMGWLTEAVRTGSVPDVPAFLVASMNIDRKGKGKADDDSAMFDITNGELLLKAYYLAFILCVRHEASFAVFNERTKGVLRP